MRKRDLGILLLCAFAIFFSLQNEGGFSFREAWYHSLDDSYPIKHVGERLPPPLVTDLNGDGRKEILVATHDAKIQILDPHSLNAEDSFAEARVIGEVSLLPDKVRVSAGRRPVAMAAGVTGRYLQSGGAATKQVLVVVTAGWSILCFDHNLNKLWEASVKDDFPHGSHHKEVAIHISNYTLTHKDQGLIIVGGSMSVQPQILLNPFEEELVAEKEAERHRHSAGTEDLEDVSVGKLWDQNRHFSYYAYSGSTGEQHWHHRSEDFRQAAQSSDEVTPQHNYRLEATSLAKPHDTEVQCRKFRESVLDVMPHRWERREDTHFELAHFRKHKRKTSKKQSGKTHNPFGKPEEKSTPGQDLTNKVVGALGKASEFAASAKRVSRAHHFSIITNHTDHWWIPNVVVAHLREGIEAVHLATGRTVCKLLLAAGGLHADINGDGILDHVQAFGGGGSEVATGTTEVVKPCWAVATSGVPVRESLFNGSICRHSPYNSFQPGDFNRAWGRAANSAPLEVAAPVVFPKPDHGQKERSFGDVIFLTSRGEVTSFSVSPGKGQDATRRWQIVTGASWTNHPAPGLQAVDGVVPTLAALPLRKGAQGEAILVAGESEAVILHPDGTRLASFNLPAAPSMPILYEDFSGDGLNDLVLVTSSGIFGFQQIRHPGAILFSSMVGLLIVVMAVIFITQHLNSPKVKPTSRQSDRK